MNIAIKRDRPPRTTDRTIRVHVAEGGTRTPKAWLRCEFDQKHLVLDSQTSVPTSSLTGTQQRTTPCSWRRSSNSRTRRRKNAERITGRESFTF